MEETKMIMAKDGRKREHTSVKCLNCEEHFWKQTRFLKNSESHYCSRECLYEFKDKQKKRTTCANCEKEFTLNEHRANASKSGLLFCSRKCKDEAQIIENGFHEMLPSHYTTGIFTYRQRALKEYDNKCSVCGYDTLEVLEVHHKDGNRNNNKLENLDILCPTHHKEYDLGIRKY